MHPDVDGHGAICFVEHSTDTLIAAASVVSYKACYSIALTAGDVAGKQG